MAGEAAKAGLPAPALWRWHDLRRTVRTGLTRLGVPREHAEASINHIGGRAGLVGTYERYDYAQEIIAALRAQVSNYPILRSSGKAWSW